MTGSYEIINKDTIKYSFNNPKNEQNKIVRTLKFYISPGAESNKLQLVYNNNIFTYRPFEVFKNDRIAGAWKGELLNSKGKATSYELILNEKGFSDGFIDGQRSHYGYYRYLSSPSGDILHLSYQIPSFGNYGIRSYSVKVQDGVMFLDPISDRPNQKTFSFKLTKVSQNSNLTGKLWWNQKGLK
ncbi:hypothetical protein AB6T38_19200 [Aliiglaciecola sp. SL4]|uniref:hypothetical protein n=1 Tax=Aliiglaciecola sp. SL4 TaxID=3239806 RepID=UPI00355C88D0